MKKRFVGLAVFLAVLLIVSGSAGIFFWARPPVVIVVDDAFLALYGKERADAKRYELSRSLRRRVVFAVVSQEAGQEAAEFAVSAASKKPFLVLFPERYLESADRYAGTIEEAGLADNIRTVVVGDGESGGVSISRAESLRIDRETDLYRAGMCAAVLAKDGSIVVYYQGSLSRAYRDVFREGLTAAGYTKAPVFYRSTETASQTDLGCIVSLSAVNTKALAGNKDIPIVLFSWLDPAYTPNGVMVVFDDSLPAVAGQVAEHSDAPTAQALVLGERISDKADLKALNAAVREERGAEGEESAESTEAQK
jgi:hypothetical protein